MESPVALNGAGLQTISALPREKPSVNQGALEKGTRTVLPAVARLLCDLVLPPRCALCGVEVSGDGGLCPACFPSVRFLVDGLCDRCGTLLPTGQRAGCCPTCLEHPPLYQRARSVFVYDQGSRSLILRLKHGDRSDLAPLLARWLARCGRDVLEDSDLIVPVPLHWRRLFLRRYNQAALLARRLGPGAYLPDLLYRTRWTRSQGEFDHHQGARTQRLANVRQAFAVRKPQRLAGRRVLLVDDVLTTGATVEECTRCLLDAGAQAVSVLTVARAVLHHDESRPRGEGP